MPKVPCFVTFLLAAIIAWAFVIVVGWLITRFVMMIEGLP